MSSSGKAPAEAKREDSSDQPLSDDQDARQPVTSTSLKELVQRAKPESSFKEDIDTSDETLQDLDDDFITKPLTSSATSSPGRSSRSPSPIHAQRPSTRARIVRNRRDRSTSKPKGPKTEGSSNPARDKILVKATATAAENVRKEKEQQDSTTSPQPTSAKQALDKAAAKSWTEKFLAREQQEALQNKSYAGPSKGKEKEKPNPGRPRSKSIRLGRNNNSDADEAEDWEKDYADLTGSYFEEPKEWLIAQGLVPKTGPPPSPRPRPYDGELENGDWDIPSITASMNNSYNFDGGNQNAARQAPNAAQAQQLNGMNGGQHWPNVGAQADMNVLWEYIQNLSQMHEGIRAQTQHVLNGVQQIQARAADDGGAVPHVNGVSNAGASQSQVAEIARLQNELSASNNKIDDLNSFVGKLQGLNQDYESALSHLMDKVRPFAQQHSQALLSQKAHYLRLIEAERSQNLELRLEQTRWQESASRINENLKEAMKALTEAELPYIRKIAALKADNKSLRRICGVPLMDDSDEDEDEDEVVEEARENVNGVVVQHESPGQMEQVGREKMLATLGQ